MKIPRFTIGYVTGGMLDQPFVDSLDKFAMFDQQNKKLCDGAMYVKGLYVDDNRNELTREFLNKSKSDYLLMVDTDIEFEPVVPYALLEDMMQHNRAIEGALYFGILYGNRMMPIWFEEGENAAVKTVKGFKTGEVIPLAAVGMGFTMIRRDVFTKMAENPEWAADSWTWFPREPCLVGEKPVRGGEDICFCLRAKQVGFQTWGNCKVEVNHWKKMPLNLEMFKMFYMNAKQQGKDY